MKTLGATELAHLRRFFKDYFYLQAVDDTGVLDELYDSALVASEILGLVDIIGGNDEDSNS